MLWVKATARSRLGNCTGTNGSFSDIMVTKHAVSRYIERVEDASKQYEEARKEIAYMVKNSTRVSLSGGKEKRLFDNYILVCVVIGSGYVKRTKVLTIHNETFQRKGTA